MKTNFQVLPAEGKSRKPPAIRFRFLLLVLGIAACIAWLAWPSEFGGSVVELSRADGKPRFKATSYSKTDLSDFTFFQRLAYLWIEYRQRKKPNPGRHSFPARPPQFCSISLLNQCMEISGTNYLIAVEAVAGTVTFGYTNRLNGAQWVAAFERAITSQEVLCWDYSQKSTFKDKLVLIREKPNLVKVIPSSKLSVYREAGLVRAETIQDRDD